MTAEATPYESVNPGDLISASLFNKMQVDIKDDITKQVSQAIGGIKQVDTATDAQKLDGKTVDQLKQEILDAVLKQMAGRTGYLRIFLRLETGREQIVSHNLKAMPLVDVYELEYFQVVCATGETPQDRNLGWVNFYLYHAMSERSIRNPAGNNPQNIEIEPRDVRPSTVLFSDILALYNVQYDDNITLDELETRFWTNFFRPPNNEFDADQYCHSPWFEKCCGEKRTVSTLKADGDWDKISFKAMPMKTVDFAKVPTIEPDQQNPPTGPAPAAPPAGGTTVTPGGLGRPPVNLGPAQLAAATAQLQVEHFDLDTVGITLLQDPTYYPNIQNFPPADPNLRPKELKVMLLLKV